MGLIKEVKYSYNDVTIVPAVVSHIRSRKQCNPFNNDGTLPIFTAPMNTVVNEHNFKKFEENNIIPILPRTVDFKIRYDNSFNGKWSAYSLNEFKEHFVKKIEGVSTPVKVLVDVANGHMKDLLESCRNAKINNGNKLIIMAGNIANPRTYLEYCRSGIDYVRCSVGTGCGCITSSNVSVHYPIVSLLSEINEKRKSINITKVLTSFEDSEIFCETKVIADGGIRNYSDAIKALALGADYVMIGGLFSQMLESAAITIDAHGEEVNIDDTIFVKDEKTYKRLDLDFNIVYREYPLYKKFYGMASKEGQIALNGEKKNTSEGICKTLSVKYTINGWTTNFIDYLRSAMSYTGCFSLKEFKNNVTLVVNSNKTYDSVNK